jgi:hypothetical protein
MFTLLSNSSLLEAYESAKFLRLDQEFISLLEMELKNRGIVIKQERVLQ